MMTGDVPLSRRQSLALIVRFMFFIAALAFIWVLLASLAVNQPADNKRTKDEINIDVSGLETGKLRKVSLSYKEIWIYRRSNRDIQQLKQHGDSLRSVADDYFVFFPYEPIRQCQVQWHEYERSFYDPCSGNQFDLAGHLLHGKQQDQVLSLPIPDYQFFAPGQLKIAARSAAIR